MAGMGGKRTLTPRIWPWRLFDCNGPRARLVVDRHKGEQAFRDLYADRSAVAPSHHLDPDLHRGPSDSFDLRIDRDQIAQDDWCNELHPLDCDGRNRPARVEPSDDAAGLVHLAQDPATENVTICVDVARSGHEAKNGFAADFGHERPFPSVVMMASSPVNPQTRNRVEPRHSLVVAPNSYGSFGWKAAVIRHR